MVMRASDLEKAGETEQSVKKTLEEVERFIYTEGALWKEEDRRQLEEHCTAAKQAVNRAFNISEGVSRFERGER